MTWDPGPGPGTFCFLCLHCSRVARGPDQGAGVPPNKYTASQQTAERSGRVDIFVALAILYPTKHVAHCGSQFDMQNWSEVLRPHRR